MSTQQVNPKTNSMFKEFAFLALAIASIFYWLAIASFKAQDKSFFSYSLPALPVTNLCGELGAQIAAVQIYYFGAISFVLPVIFFLGLSTYFKKQHQPLTILAICMTTFLCIGLIASSIWDTVYVQSLLFPTFGSAGIFVNQFLSKYLGTYGSWIILLGLQTACLLHLQNKIFLRLSNKISDWLTLPKLSFQKLNFWNKQQTNEESDRNNTSTSAVSREFQIEPTIDLESSEPAAYSFSSSLMSDANDETNQIFYEKNADYQAPPAHIFKQAEINKFPLLSTKELESIADLLVKTFAEFDVQGQIIGFQPGPVVTVYEFQPEAGIKQNKVFSLIDDIALALKVDSILIHPIPGKRALGVQVPNPKRETVYMGDILSSDSFKLAHSPLNFAMGKSLNGDPICADLAAMPHLLCAGATGSGKSVAINGLISSIIMRVSPENVRMILVDPKMLELSVYDGIPHLLMPVITEPQRASMALNWATHEMERRYKIMQHASVRHISGFNQFWDTASEEKKHSLCTLFPNETLGKLPYILIVIDELADLMLTAPKDVESSIQRLSQKARASGIHMVLATQRPSVDIITGVIKANLPCRISFQVVSKHDSRTILDQMGAEKLLGKGDMLFQRPGIGRLERIQGAFISDDEVLSLVTEVKKNGEASYDQEIMKWIDQEMTRLKSDDEELDMLDVDEDPKFSEAVQIGKNHGVMSASFLQRHLKIGYNRAARMVDYMEAKGLVSKSDGSSKPRRWIASV